ncbi:hypothetical protein [Streptomyces sp. URMC 125]|uniref:hypothetical protein n=1 Tax=Streptomyces sp. URMC 125 TaxID=3423419 RepID=UPI003F1DCF1F
MDEYHARLTAETMRRLGLPGVAAPVAEVTGEWAIYDRRQAPRAEITATVTAVIRERLGGRHGLPWPAASAARGFVFPNLRT